MGVGILRCDHIPHAVVAVKQRIILAVFAFSDETDLEVFNPRENNLLANIENGISSKMPVIDITAVTQCTIQ